MKGLKKKQNLGRNGNLAKNLKAKTKKIKIPEKIKEQIATNRMDESNEWMVPKKTAKNFVSKPKKDKVNPPAEILAGNAGSSSNTPRLYIRFPKSLETMNLDHDKLRALHHDIIDVRIPRKKLHSKWFLAVFETEEKALAAKDDLSAKGGCVVMAQFSKIEREKRKKTPKTNKQSLIRNWTLQKMDVADEDD